VHRLTTTPGVGFWPDEDARRTFVPWGYVEVTTDDAKPAVGGNSLDFVATFCHKIGHVIIRNLIPGFADRPAPSTKMHMSMAVTDCQTAFGEEYAVHFRTVVQDKVHREASATSGRPGQASLARQLTKPRHNSIALSRRTHGVLRNLCIYERAQPADVFDSLHPYELYLDSETHTRFNRDALKSGQRMLACEYLAWR
jgi:hypothetical protein